MLARPRSSTSTLTSRKMTETPRELSHCAIPEPITPAPMTAACVIFSAGALLVPLRYRSARKKLRIRLWVDSVSPSSTIASSSRASDSSTEPVRLWLMISAARAGAGFWERGASIEPGRAEARPLRRDSLLRVQFRPCGFEQLVLRDHFIDQAELQSFRRGIKFSFQNDFRGFLRTDQTRQARRATPRRHQTERRFRQTDPRRGRIRRDAIVTGERDLVAAAGTSAVDRRHRRNFQRSQSIEDALTFGNEGAHLAGLRLTEQRLQISARDEDRFLRRGHDHAFETGLLFDEIEMLAQDPARWQRQRCSRPNPADRRSERKFRRRQFRAGS